MVMLAPALAPDPVLAAPAFDDDFPVYPAGFPVPDRTPYAYTVDMGVVRSDFAAGNARQRRAFRTMPHALALSFRMRIEMLYLWQNWVNEFGFAWFHCPVSVMYAGGPPDPGNMRYELLRFSSDLAVQMEGWDFVAVGVGAELSPQAFANDPGFGAGGWVVGGTPGAPSPIWVIGGTPSAPSPDWIIAGAPETPAVPLREVLA